MRCRALLVFMMLMSPCVLAEQSDLDPQVVSLLNTISEQRMEATLKKLASFGTRNTLSSTTSKQHGIGAARQWIFDTMASYSPKLQVAFDSYQLEKQGRITRDVELRNVLAVLKGRSSRRIYMSGHYDSIAYPGGMSATNAGVQPPQVPRASSDDDNKAPGVNDDGSGVAITMELARVFSQSGIDFDATLVFICHAGEEQGLFGSRLQAKKAADEKTPIQAVLNNDIVGGGIDAYGIADRASVRVYSAGPEDSPSRSLARYVVRWGTRYVPSHRIRLMARPDRFDRSSDHQSYEHFGFAALCFRDSRENFLREHDVRDTFEGISLPYLAQNARVNAASAAMLALAPPPPEVNDADGTPMISREPTGYDAKLSWNAAPGATTYRIFWRDAWGPDWQHDLLVGNVTSATLPGLIIDNMVFGVAAIDGLWHESSISAYVESRRERPPVKTLGN